MPLSSQEKLLANHFAEFISEHKKEFVERVLNERTRHLTVVLEDIFQSHNASAAVRTCECMGVQDVHIIENTTTYEVNKYVLKGSYKWETLVRYKKTNENNTQYCYDALRASGYRIYATDPSPGNKSIHDIDITQSPVALVFGNELRGLSDYALQHADEKVSIPMYGFTESLNISVSVAVCLATLLPKLKANPEQFTLSADEKDELRLNWYRKMMRRPDIMEKLFLKTIP
jgi:tRNA (guanosine-2'-O-)-methyltransferase